MSTDLLATLMKANTWKEPHRAAIDEAFQQLQREPSADLLRAVAKARYITNLQADGLADDKEQDPVLIGSILIAEAIRNRPR